MTPGGVTAAMLDDLDPRPIFIDAGSLHSCWCNTAALEELEVDGMPDPAGGKIYRDADGKPSGLLDEGAMMSISKFYQTKLSIALKTNRNGQFGLSKQSHPPNMNE